MIRFLLHLLFRSKKQYKDIGYSANTSIDCQDIRDYVYLETNKQLSDMYTIPNLPPIRQQGILSSCASFAVVAAYEIQFKPHQYIEGSELFHYFNVRVGTLKTLDNVGMTIRQACDGLKRDGFALEYLCPYNINDFNTKPNHVAYIMTSLYQTEKYERLNSLKAIKESIDENIPVICGIRIQNEFKLLNQTNYIYSPKTDEGSGHAVLIVGYNDITERFLFRNSWSESWGNKGYFEMSYNTFEDISFDWWRILSARRKKLKII